MKQKLALTQRAGLANKLARCFRMLFYFCLLLSVLLAVALVFYRAVGLLCVFFVCVGITLLVDYLVNRFEAAASAEQK